MSVEDKAQHGRSCRDDAGLCRVSEDSWLRIRCFRHLRSGTGSSFIQSGSGGENGGKSMELTDHHGQ